ncbi:MAG: SDR family NAD(P)-dependent oxidoreductase [Candidatus Sericytochromatia bacterium]|nr:SDR family NAD(P)-dependent oxidoreductase [Candidatus Sericytochromatia bacterium]
MDLKDARVLVIGGAGFIGSHVVDLLTKEPVKEVIVYDNFCRGTQANLEDAFTDKRVRIFDVGGDITQSDILQAAMKNVDAVVHLAALWLLQCHDYPRAAFDVNIRGTFNILEACRDNNVKRLVYSSSASVYGDAVEIPMTEEHPFANKTFYGATKIAGEQMARAFYHRYNLPYVGLRYMNVYGARQDYKGTYIAVIMKILDRLDQDLPPVLYGDGSQTYDFIYVEDCAKANVCALKSAAADYNYNVGSGTGTSLKELTEMILKLTGKEHLGIQYEPAGQTFVTNRIGSTSRAKKDLGFQTSIDLADGLRRLIAWRNDHKALVAKQALQAAVR